MKKEELRYLQRLAELYPTIGKASTEIINLQSILNLPKGTEHFMSDLHGEYEAFSHVLRNCLLYTSKKSYDNGTDFSFVEQKVREVQTTIENAVKTSNYQELNQSITKMVNNTLKQYQKEHPATVQKKTEHKVMNQKIQETHPELYGNTGGEKVKDILLIVFGGLLSGSMAIGLLTVQILQAVIGHGGITSTAVTLIGTLAGVGMIYGGCTGLGRLKRFKKYVQALGDLSLIHI